MALLFAEGTLDATSLAVIVGVAIVGYGVTYFLSQRALKQTIAELRREFEQRLASAVAKPVAAPVAVVAPPVAPAVVAQPVAAVKPVEAAREEVTPETLLILAAAVTAFL